jgi:hypothetical protein
MMAAPLDGRTLREFAERGFIVVRNVVSADLLDAAMREIDGIIARRAASGGSSRLPFLLAERPN